MKTTCFHSLAGCRMTGLWLCSLISLTLSAQPDTIPFDTIRWDLSRARIVEHLGRQAITGSAILKNSSFENGIIEVDIAAIERTRSYPGILFRVQDPSTSERIYIRPHRSPFYDDALQYAPSFNGVDSWQLYSGPGQSAGLEILPGQWNRLKIRIAGSRADVYWNDSKKPVMQIDRLSHGISRGGVGLSDPLTGTAFYSNFSFREIDTLSLPVAIQAEPVVGILSEWEMSTPMPLVSAILEQYPGDSLLSALSWQPVTPDSKGVVDISRYYPRKRRLGDCILARATLQVERDTVLQVGFGYSDLITVYLNEKPLYSGNSAYRSRDNSFLGIVGYFDALYLPLKKGPNELMVQVGESMGGWAFCFRKAREVFLDPSITKKWENKRAFSLPEAIVYDPVEEVCYVSNYFNEGNEYISKITPTGEVISAEWIKGIRMPTGLCIRDHTLYVVDRTGVNVIDTREGRIVEKISGDGMQGANDVEMDRDGNLYISETSSNTIYRYASGVMETYLEGEFLNGPNGLLVDGDQLLIGQNEQLLIADIPTRQVKVLVSLEQGSNIDGVQKDGKGNYLISDYHGKLYRVTPGGEKTLLINTSTPGDFIADFAFIPGKNLLIIPTLTANSVTGYSISWPH